MKRLRTRKFTTEKQKQLAKEYLQSLQTTGVPSTDIFVAHFDGCCEPVNPGGNMGVGAVIKQNGKKLFQYSHFIRAKPHNTNNVAEYLGMEAILDFIISNEWEGRILTVYGDSKLVIEQLFGTWKVRGGLYVPFFVSCKNKLAQARAMNNSIDGIWIPREQNFDADTLSKQELIDNNVQFKLQKL